MEQERKISKVGCNIPTVNRYCIQDFLDSLVGVLEFEKPKGGAHKRFYNTATTHRHEESSDVDDINNKKPAR